MASRRELQLFKALLLAICKASCSCSQVLSSPGGVGSGAWEALASAAARCVGLVSAGLCRAFEALQCCLISAATKGDVELNWEIVPWGFASSSSVLPETNLSVLKRPTNSSLTIIPTGCKYLIPMEARMGG